MYSFFGSKLCSASCLFTQLEFTSETLSFLVFIFLLSLITKFDHDVVLKMKLSLFSHFQCVICITEYI